MSVVIDASAALAVLNCELGAERTEDIPVGGLISATNFSEVLSKLVDVGLTTTRPSAHLMHSC